MGAIKPNVIHHEPPKLLIQVYCLLIGYPDCEILQVKDLRIIIIAGLADLEDIYLVVEEVDGGLDLAPPLLPAHEPEQIHEIIEAVLLLEPLKFLVAPPHYSHDHCRCYPVLVRIVPHYQFFKLTNKAVENVLALVPRLFVFVLYLLNLKQYLENYVGVAMVPNVLQPHNFLIFNSF